ncbi:MAG: tRNA pseudouridine(38-40) synthase TruA [Candidatus Margulisiibacteriota bacterium]
MKNYKLVLAYDGSDFLGWQRQKIDDNTVAGKLEQALKLVAQGHEKIQAAGRTDRGVHALGQVVSFKADIKIPLKRLPKVINSHLPRSIRVLKVDIVPDDFQARFSAKAREYVYLLALNEQVPIFMEPYIAHLDQKTQVDLVKMRKAAKVLLGEKYLKTFCSTGSGNKIFNRRIFSISIRSRVLVDQFGKRLKVTEFKLKANAFLYRMVRNIVSALLDVGTGELDLADFARVVASGDRRKIGSPAPAEGLYLNKVYY